MHSFPGVGSVTRISYGLSTIRILRILRDDFIISSIGAEEHRVAEELPLLTASRICQGSLKGI